MFAIIIKSKSTQIIQTVYAASCGLLGNIIHLHVCFTNNGVFLLYHIQRGNRTFPINVIDIEI